MRSMFAYCLNKYCPRRLLTGLAILVVTGSPVFPADQGADGLPYDHGSIPAGISVPDRIVGERVYKDKGCIECHGPRGFSNDPDLFPRLAGLDGQYIIEQLTAFQSGSRQNVIMSPVAATLTADDIIALAAFISGGKPD